VTNNLSGHYYLLPKIAIFFLVDCLCKRCTRPENEALRLMICWLPSG